MNSEKHSSSIIFLIKGGIIMKRYLSVLICVSFLLGFVPPIKARAATSVARDDGTWLWPLASSTYNRISDWAGAADNKVVSNKCKVCGGKHSSTWGTAGRNEQNGHNGIDISVSNANVLASAAGVAYTYNNASRGLTVVIEHKIAGTNYSYYSYYQHCSKLNVKNKQNVTAGQVIAVSGSTGYSNGAHLHFGIVLGTSNDPSLSHISKCENKGWLMTSGLREGSVLNNPAKNNDCGFPVKSAYNNAVLPPLKAHYGSTSYTFNASKVKIGSVNTVTKKVASNITFSNMKAPTTLDEGAYYTVKGTVNSTVPIKTVNIGVYDSKGTRLTGKMASNINSLSYNLNKLDAFILFNRVKNGVAYYRVEVTDTNGTTREWEAKYTVKTALKQASSFDLCKSTMTYRRGYYISGVIGVKNANVKIKKVRIGVYNSKGQLMSVASAASSDNLNVSSYNLKKLDSKICYNKLGKGAYTVKVFAQTNISKTEVQIYSKAFTVK